MKKTIHKTYSCWLLALFTCFSVHAVDINNQTFNGTVNTQAAEEININNSTFTSSATGTVRSTSKIRLGIGTKVNTGANVAFRIGPLSTYSVAFTAGANGSLAGAQTQTITHGQSTTAVTATPDSGYYFVNWTDGTNTYTDNPLTLTNVTSALNLTANFAINQYTLTFTAGANGSIQGNSPQTINHNENSTAVSAIPDPAYRFDYWSDGTNTYTDNPLVLTNITSGKNLTAHFIIDRFPVTFTAGDHGSILGETHQLITSGEATAQVTAVANDTYEFKRWSDGSTENPRIISNVTQEINLTAEFGKPLVIEFGNALADSEWQTINFTKSFTNPLVIAGPPSYNDSHESVVRIQNVTATGFEIRVQEWDYLDGSHASENIDYIVIEKGLHILSDGRIIEAGTVDLSDSSYQTISYQPQAASPVVLSSILTNNDPAAATRRLRNISLDSFQIRLQEEESADGVHANETVAYVVLPKGDYNIMGEQLTVGVQSGIKDLWAAVPSSGFEKFISTFQTTAGTDPGVMRQRGTVGTDLEIHFEEEQSADSEKGHARETAGFIMVKPFTGPKIEFGSVSANHLFKTVNFTKTFVDPVVVAGPPSYNGWNESVVRIQNVTANGFEIRVQEWDYLDGAHANENIDFMVIEKGIHTLEDGRIIEAGTVDLSNSSYQTVAFATQAAKPVVLSSILTNNDPAAATRRLRNISLDLFQVKLQEEESADGVHATETVSYIVLPKGDFSIQEEDLSVGVQSGVTDTWLAVPSSGFRKFISTFQTTAGNDPGVMRRQGTVGSNLEIHFEEEQSADSEKDHANETAGFILTGTSTATYTVNFQTDGNGTITGTNPQTVEAGQSTTVVTALPNEGYVFEKWSDESTVNPKVFENITGDMTITAHFKLENGGPGGPVTGSILSQTFEHSNFNRRDTLTYGDGTTWAYTYDAMGNVNSAVKTHGSDPAQNLLFNYTFDDIGNRLTATEAGVSKTYTPNSLNQYDQIVVGSQTIIIEYDADGNPTTHKDWDLTWDAEDRLWKMVHQIEDIVIDFVYDYRGFRGEKKVTVNGIVEKHIAYHYDGNLVSAEFDVRDGNAKPIRVYTWGLDPAGTRQEVGGIGALVGMESFDENGVDSEKFHVVSDAGGNVVNLLKSEDDGTLTVANSYEYGPAGQLLNKQETVFNPHRFNSKPIIDERVGNNDYDYGYRPYDAENGRWWNQDPIGVAGGINLYNSVSNNMVNGYVGGQSYSSGMEFGVGDLQEGLGVDPDGLALYAFDGTNNTPSDNTNIHLMRNLYIGTKAIYEPGVGNALEYNKFEGLIRKATGWGVEAKKSKMLKELAKRIEKYNDLDVDVVGFSRGAVTAIVFAEALEKLIDEGVHPYCKVKEIRFMGLFDPVPGPTIKHRPKIPDLVKRSSIAYAIDEKRISFTASVYNNGGNVTARAFTGGHSDIGGGYKRRGLADISLIWMIRQGLVAGAPFRQYGTISRELVRHQEVGPAGGVFRGGSFADRQLRIPFHHSVSKLVVDKILIDRSNSFGSFSSRQSKDNPSINVYDLDEILYKWK